MGKVVARRAELPRKLSATILSDKVIETGLISWQKTARYVAVANHSRIQRDPVDRHVLDQ